jgi:hypothetical protein
MEIPGYAVQSREAKTEIPLQISGKLRLESFETEIGTPSSYADRNLSIRVNALRESEQDSCDEANLKIPGERAGFDRPKSETWGRFVRFLLRLGFCFVLLASCVALAQTGPALPVVDPSTIIPNGPGFGTTRPASSGPVLTGAVQMGIKLQDPPLVVAVGSRAKRQGIRMRADQQRAYLAGLKQKQDTLMSQISGLGGTELGRVSKGHNALMVSIDASRIAALKTSRASYRCALSSIHIPRRRHNPTWRPPWTIWALWWFRTAASRVKGFAVQIYVEIERELLEDPDDWRVTQIAASVSD